MSEDFNYGGQAVIEGVMMRGARNMAVAVRAPDGRIEMRDEELTAAVYTSRLGKLPFIRGLGLLWDALGLGTKALMWSANVALEEEEEDVSFEGVAAWGTLAISLTLAVSLFFVLPLLIVHWLDQFIASALVSNLVEGVIRLAFLLAYIIIIGRMEDIKRVFAYHGAEHKTINAYEAGVDLTPENVRPYSLLHPRCGTGFLLVVVVISILIFALLGRPPIFWRIVSRIVLIPVIAGISYEFIRFSAKHYEHPFVRILITPSLMLQKLTTNEPSDDMLEVAIHALERVLALEDAETVETVPASSLEPAPAPVAVESSTTSET